MVPYYNTLSNKYVIFMYYRDDYEPTVIVSDEQERDII